MRKKNTESLGDVLRQYLKMRKLDRPLNEKRLIDAWPEVLGQNIKTYTTELYIRNRKLYVTISSSVLRHDLFITRENIVESLNKQVGASVIDDIVFR